MGIRENEGKPRWSLVDFESFESMVKVLEQGAEKYGKYNWQKGLKVTETAESLLRHIFSFLAGNDIDADSGLEHIGHIQANAMFLGYMMKNRKDLDDRNKNKEERLGI